MPEQGKSKNVLLFTGHLIDAAGRPQKRFPIELMDRARDLIKIYLEEELRLQPPDLAITSLGAGGDMIFADEILKLGSMLIRVGKI